MSNNSLFSSRQLLFYNQLHIIVIAINSQFNLSEIKLYHITISVNQNDIEHILKVAITAA